jgi:hypothetical protein
VAIPLLVTVASLAWHTRARADDRALGDAVVAPGGDACLGREALAEAVAAWLGTDRVGARTSVLVQPVGPSGRGAERLEVVLLEGDEVRATRRFERLPRACPDRRAIVSLAIALAIDADVLVRAGAAPGDASGAGSRGASGQRARAARSAPTVDVSGRSAPRRGRGVVRLALAIEGGGAFGLVQAPVGTLAVDAALRLGPRVSVSLAGLASSLASGDLGVGTASLRLAGGRALACALEPVGALVAALCGGALVAAALAEGRGFDRDARDLAPLVAALTRVELGVRVATGLTLYAAADGVLALVRPRLIVHGDGGAVAAETTPPLGVAVVAGVRLAP